MPDKSLLIFSGKGGAGKSTVAAARRGKRVLIVEIGDRERIPSLFGPGKRSGYAGGAKQEWRRCGRYLFPLTS